MTSVESLNDVEILGAGPDEAPVAARIIADAFQHLDVAKWLVPDQEQRRSVVERNMLIWTTHAVKHGLISLTADETGVAVWFPTAEPVPAPDDYDEKLATACGQWADAFRQLDDVFERHHQHGEPHHHLAFLAVRPGHQGEGIGTALLHHHHEMYPDVAMYLEASSRASRALYLRHGYLDRGRFTLPDGPPLWAMWRPSM
ncbi:MAG TPA: GNAT family N-acetyltransferase [Pseudonocardiaceae bacterium]|nr:GNAT family N-acetyltransferase [Pseudonocardiaceae bacterium]